MTQRVGEHERELRARALGELVAASELSSATQAWAKEPRTWWINLDSGGHAAGAHALECCAASESSWPPETRTVGPVSWSELLSEADMGSALIHACCGAGRELNGWLLRATLGGETLSPLGRSRLRAAGELMTERLGEGQTPSEEEVAVIGLLLDQHREYPELDATRGGLRDALGRRALGQELVRLGARVAAHMEDMESAPEDILAPSGLDLFHTVDAWGVGVLEEGIEVWIKLLVLGVVSELGVEHGPQERAVVLPVSLLAAWRGAGLLRAAWWERELAPPSRHQLQLLEELVASDMALAQLWEQGERPASSARLGELLLAARAAVEAVRSRADAEKGQSRTVESTSPSGPVEELA